MTTGTEQPPAGATLATCRGRTCTQQVFFAYHLRKDGTVGDKPAPIDWPRDPGKGHLLLVGTHSGAPLVRAATPAEKEDPALRLYTAHHATCPDVDEFRRRK